MSRPGDVPVLLVEAFSDGPFAGNGAGVVLLESPPTAAWMQSVAGSLRQSETAFLVPAEEGWLLRWFTPRCEVPLCGHATLAALLALRHWGRLPPYAPTVFHTLSGPLPVRIDPHDDRLGQLELPHGQCRLETVSEELLDLMRQVLGCEVELFWRSSLGYAIGLLPADAPLAAMEPIAGRLPADLRRGLVLMQALSEPKPAAPFPSVGGQRADYQLRFFAPGLGIDEDPVTGSAHALVAPYWIQRLARSRIVGWQCSDRPGGMGCEPGSSGMIRLSGSGFVLWEGWLRAPPMISGASAAGDPDRGDGWSLQSRPPDRGFGATPS